MSRANNQVVSRNDYHSLSERVTTLLESYRENGRIKSDVYILINLIRSRLFLLSLRSQQDYDTDLSISDGNTILDSILAPVIGRTFFTHLLLSLELHSYQTSSVKRRKTDFDTKCAQYFEEIRETLDNKCDLDLNCLKAHADIEHTHKIEIEQESKNLMLHNDILETKGHYIQENPKHIIEQKEQSKDTKERTSKVKKNIQLLTQLSLTFIRGYVLEDTNRTLPPRIELLQNRCFHNLNKY